MNDMIELDIEALRKAKVSLEKAYNVFINGDNDEDILAIYADSCVKRYEYTFETAWKTMKKYFKLQYGKKEEDLTMNNIFRFMEAYGFAKDWTNWRDYYTKRNSTAHKYNIEKSRNLLEKNPEFIKSVDFLLEKWDSI